YPCHGGPRVPMTTTRPYVARSRPVAVPAVLLSGLLAGGSEPPSATTPPAPVSLTTSPPPKGADLPAIRMEKSGRKAVLAGFKDAMTGSAEARGIDIRSFRFSGLTEPLEVLVQIEQNPAPQGSNGPETISLTTEGPPILQG